MTSAFFLMSVKARAQFPEPTSKSTMWLFYAYSPSVEEEKPELWGSLASQSSLSMNPKTQ